MNLGEHALFEFDSQHLMISHSHIKFLFYVSKRDTYSVDMIIILQTTSCRANELKITVLINQNDLNFRILPWLLLIQPFNQIFSHV